LYVDVQEIYKKYKYVISLLGNCSVSFRKNGHGREG